MNQQLCIEQTTLRKFLQASRKTNDVLIKDFFSKNESKLSPSNSPPDCKDLISSLNLETVKRTSILKYCDSVYEQLLSQEEEHQKQTKNESLNTTNGHDGPMFNGRVNPYSEEDYNNQINKNFEISNSMKYWLLNEYQVEQILNADNLKKLKNNNCFDFSRFMEN